MGRFLRNGGRQLLGGLARHGPAALKWEHAWLADSSGLERNSRAQSIANGIHLQRWNLSQRHRMSMSDGGSGDFKRDLRSRNTIYGLDSEEGCYSTA